MNLRTFFSKKRDVLRGVHVSNYDDARLFCNKATLKGHKWANGENYADNTRYNVYKEDTVYLSDGTLCSVNAIYSELDFEMLEFNQMDFTR